MPVSGPVTRSTLRQQIADALRDEVLAGRLRPGREFTVKQIAEQYGVSATPVREALVDLSAQGLLDSDQHRGFRVHRFTVDDYRDMVEARFLIVDGLLRRHPEGGAEWGRVPDEVLVSVRRRAEAAVRAARAGDLDILIGYDMRFWQELAGLAANRHLAGFLDRLRVQAWAFAVPHLRADRRVRDRLWAGYEELAEAVEEGSARRVAAVLAAYRAHSLNWADHLERLPAPREAPERPA
ncbi:GntR family transcriptional regulator [Streptomyces sudanensis]|uniref:GntR family transcriptional regulator n=1 Tax=Streptomyces sudanensis TaxID=436397 RepID=UPI0020CDE28D|nr:GntR family transcriptional regulator [Streptomyces sudanensis]MCP9958033.1 GntR family transcriptional regulator [Streptomyces sudanensis]MCP9987157.1 GntR family transcriptional regulator [Streptomyces sudanensis]MCQ0001441.1 GntR family transcriptional regulator [Streptomyces sudanensis]